MAITVGEVEATLRLKDEMSAQMRSAASAASAAMGQISESSKSTSAAIRLTNEQMQRFKELMAGGMDYKAAADAASRYEHAAQQVATEQAAVASSAQAAAESMKATADSTKAAADSAKAHTVSLREQGMALRELGVGLSAAVTVPLVAAATAALHFGTEFQTNMTRVQSLAGASAEEVASLRQRVLDLGPSTGIGPGELAKGLFVLESAGQRGSEAMHSLKIAADMSAIGLGTMDQTARALVGVMLSYKEQNLSAAEAADILTRTVQLGNMKIDELVPSLNRVNPLAAAMGLKFQDVAASIATFTHMGASVDVAVTGLRAVLTAILNDSVKTEAGFQHLAKATGDTSISMDNFVRSMKANGLAKALDDLTAQSERAGEAGVKILHEIFPNIRALTDVLATAKANGDMYLAISDKMMAKNTTLADSVKATKTTFDQQWREMIATFERAAIALGDGLLPAFTRVVVYMRTSVLPTVLSVASAFRDLPAALQDTVIAAAAVLAALGPLLILGGTLVGTYARIAPLFAEGAVGATALASAFAALTSPITLIVGSIAGVTTAIAAMTGSWTTALEIMFPPIGGLIKAWQDLREEIGQHAALLRTIKGIVVDVASIVRDVFVLAVEGAKTSLKAFADLVAMELNKALGAMKGHIADVSGAFTFIKNSIIEALTPFKEWIAIQILLKSGLTAAKASLDDMAGITKRLADEAQGHISGVTQLGQSYAALQPAITGVTAAAETHVRTTQTLAERVKDLTEAQRDAIRTHIAEGEDIKNISRETGIATDVIAAFIRQEKAATHATAEMRGEIAKHADTMKDWEEQWKVFGQIHQQSILLAIDREKAYTAEQLRQLAARNKDIVDAYNMRQGNENKQMDDLAKQNLSQFDQQRRAVLEAANNQQDALNKMSNKGSVIWQEAWQSNLDTTREKLEAIAQAEHEFFAKQTQEVDAAEHHWSEKTLHSVGVMTQALSQMGQAAGGTFGVALTGASQLMNIMAQYNAGKLSGGAAVGGGIGVGASMVAQAMGPQTSTGGLVAQGALQGAAYGSVVPGYGTAVGAGVGALAGWISSMKEWHKVTQDLERDYSGIHISEDLAKAIDQIEDQTGLMRAQATLTQLDKIIEEAGGLNPSNLSAFTGHLHDAFSYLEQGSLSTAQVTQILDKNFAQFAAAGTDSFGRLSDSIKDIIQLNAHFGTQSKAITEYLEKQAQTAAGAFSAIAAGVLDANIMKNFDKFKKDVDDARTSGHGLQAALDAQHGAATAAAGGLADLGVQAVASFGAMRAAGMTEAQALQALHPALAQMQQAYTDLGLNIDDAALAEIMFRDKITAANPQLMAAIGGLSAEMVSLDNMGVMNQHTFEAMERSGQTLYERLRASVQETMGTTASFDDVNRETLVQMQDYLHQAQIEAHNLGVPLDENTQRMIDQSQEMGIWHATNRSATEQMTDGVNSLVDRMNALIDALTGVTRETNTAGGTASHGFGDARQEVERFRTSVQHARDDMQDFGDTGYDATHAVAYGHSPGGLNDIEQHLRLVGGLFTNVGSLAKNALDAVVAKQREAADGLQIYQDRLSTIGTVAGLANQIGSSLSAYINGSGDAKTIRDQMAQLDAREAQIKQQQEDRAQQQILKNLQDQRTSIDSTNHTALAAIDAQIKAQQELIDQTQKQRQIAADAAALADIAAQRQKAQTELGKATSGGLGQKSAFDSALHLAVAAFAQQTQMTGDAVSSMQAVEPAFKAIDEAQQKYGFTTSASMQKIIDLYKTIRDNGPVVSAISADNQALQALHATGMLDAETLHMFAADATENFKALTGAGVSTNKALSLMAPTMQILGAHQKELGDITDTTTLSMWNMAKQYGFVGDSMIDTNKAILESLLDVLDAMNGTPGAHKSGKGNGPTRTAGGGGVTGLLDENMRGSASEALDYINRTIGRSLTQSEIDQAISLIGYTGGDVTGHQVNQILRALASHTIHMAEGGAGRATGPTLFYSGGDEDYAFSGEGRSFDDRGGGGSEDLNAVIRSLPFLIRNAVRDGLQRQPARRR